MSGTQNHREEWRVEPGIGKPSCSADPAHGTQSLNAASGHKRWLGGPFGKLQARDSKLFNILGDAVR